PKELLETPAEQVAFVTSNGSPVYGLKGKKVLIFSTFKDTTRYLHRRLTEDAKWLKVAGNPHIRRIDSGNHPDERGHIIAQFAPAASGGSGPPGEEIDILISTDVLSEGQNLQD